MSSVSNIIVLGERANERRQNKLAGGIPSRPSGIGKRSTFDELREALIFEARQLWGKRRSMPASPPEITAGRTQKVGTEEGDQLLPRKTRTVPVASAMIENYRKKKSSLEELVLELYHAEVSTKAVDDITTSLWGRPLNSDAIGGLSRQATVEITTWLKRPLAPRFKIVFAEGTLLRWGAGHEEYSIPILVAMGVNLAGYREIVGVMKGSRTKTADFAALFQLLRERGLREVDLFVGDHLSGFGSGQREIFPNSDCQGCIKRFSEHALELTTGAHLSSVAAMLEEIYNCRDTISARAKIRRCILTLEQMQQLEVANLLRAHAEPTLTFFGHPESLKPFITSNATLVKNLKKIRERGRTIGAFSDDATAVTLAAARLRHEMRTVWGRYPYVKHEHNSAEPMRSSA
jgi:transposase-like protein